MSAHVQNQLALASEQIGVLDSVAQTVLHERFNVPKARHVQRAQINEKLLKVAPDLAVRVHAAIVGEGDMASAKRLVSEAADTWLASDPDGHALFQSNITAGQYAFLMIAAGRSPPRDGLSYCIAQAEGHDNDSRRHGGHLLRREIRASGDEPPPFDAAVNDPRGAVETVNSTRRKVIAPVPPSQKISGTPQKPN